MDISISSIEYKDISSIIEYSNNAKLHPDEQINQIVESISEFSFIDPVAVDEDGVLLEGHGRVMAARKLGIEQIPVIEITGLTEAQKKGYRLAHNKLTLNSAFDNDKLMAELDALAQEDFDLNLTGFSSQELDELLESTNNDSDSDVASDEDEIPEPDEVEPRCKLGEIWALGEHRLFIGDSTNPENVKRLMGENKAVLMATDPPYGDSWVQKARNMQKHGYGHSHAGLHGSIENDNLKDTDLASFLAKFLSASKIAGDPPFPAYVWHRAKRMLFEQAMVNAGYLVHQPVVWVKPGFVIGRLHYHPRCEWALHGWLRGGGKCPFYGERNQSDVWEVSRENDKIHPTQKPLELFNIPIRNHTKINEIVYDPFLGSGTCLIASHQLNRRCFGFELQLNYAEVIMQRWENLTGETAQLVSSNMD